MKHISILILLIFSILVFSQNKEVIIIDDGVSIRKIYEDENTGNLKSGDSIIITDYSTLNLRNKEIKNQEQKAEKTTFSPGIINSAASLIKPEEIYTFKKNSKYKIYQPNFLNNEVVVEVSLDEKINEKQLTDLNKTVKFLNFVNTTKYVNPKESNIRKFDYIFGKGKYSYSMVLHAVQRATLLIYFNRNQITKENLERLEKTLSEFNFIKEISGLNMLMKGNKGNYIIMET